MAIAISEESPARLTNLQPLWHNSVPRRVVQQCPADDPLRGWTTWQKYLARRKSLRVPPLVPGLAWDALIAVARAEMAADARLDLPQALETVGLAYALPKLSGELSGKAWWQLVERLHDVAVAAQVERIAWPGDPLNVLRAQLLTGELPLALSYMLPEVRALRALRKTARAMLSESLLELTDGHGLPHARLLPALPELFACWTRVRWLGARMKGGCWSVDADVQYDWLVQHAVRLVDADGQFMLVPHGDDPAKSWPKELFATALELVGDKNQCAAAAAALPTRVVPRKIRYHDNHLPTASLESDWSGIAVLSDGWSRSATRLALAFADDPVRMELTVGHDKLIVGNWTSETTCDGTPVQIAGEWEELAWESDKRFDYIELGVDLSDGLRLERQVLLAHDDHVLFLSDLVLSTVSAPRQLRHTVHLPIAAGVGWQPEIETRDGVLVVGKHRAAVLPMALREWRSDPRSGSLAAEARQLMLTQEATGRALCCPLLVDLKPRRSKLERTWRQLTVAESLEIVPHDVAVGFRAQSGRDQWVFYRSLGPAGNRTLLGYNVAGEFAAGRFLPSGKIKEWVEIEAE